MSPTEPQRFTVECLACGTQRGASGFRHFELGECPECGYVGWDLPERLHGGRSVDAEVHALLGRRRVLT